MQRGLGRAPRIENRKRVTDWKHWMGSEERERNVEAIAYRGCESLAYGQTIVSRHWLHQTKKRKLKDNHYQSLQVEWIWCLITRQKGQQLM